MKHASVSITIAVPAGVFGRDFEVPLGHSPEFTRELLAIHLLEVMRDLVQFIDRHGAVADVPGQMTLGLDPRPARAAAGGPSSPTPPAPRAEAPRNKRTRRAAV